MGILSSFSLSLISSRSQNGEQGELQIVVRVDCELVKSLLLHDGEKPLMREHGEHSVMHLVLTQAYRVHMSCLCGIPEPGLRVQEWREEKRPSEEISFGSSLL